MAGMIDAAAQYASRGFKVFPVGIDKTPLCAHGLKDATDTQEGVADFWLQWPDAGIGLVTEGLIVLDFDAAHGGLESRVKLQEKYGLPATRVHMTGGGGFHYIYRNPNGTNIRNTVKLGGYDGVDIRANGGYIVVPPSKHKSGKHYKVIDRAEICEAPEWLMQLCRERASAPPPSGSGESTAPIPDSMRNQTLTSLGGTMRRRGMSQQAIEAALMAENITRCKPPLSESEIAKIAKSVSRYNPDPLATISDTTDTTDQTDPVDSVDSVDSVDIYRLAADQGKPGLGAVGIDKVVWPLVHNWLVAHHGERFDLDTLCRQLDIKTRDIRHSAVKKLSYEVSRGNLEKSAGQRPPLYIVIDKTRIRMNWRDAIGGKALDGLQWPMGRDGSRFGFDGYVEIPEKALIVLAGVTNMGKSVFCRNLLWANMDTYPCYYFSSETSEEDFADYASRMTWADPFTSSGKEKFELISRNKDWKYAIEPNGVNIIDWLNLGDQFYQIGVILEGIKERLNKGICVIAIQKDPVKDLGMGGMWGEHLASLYLTLDFGKITVKKAKKWHDSNPNGRSWGFEVVDRGAHFSNIREIKKCPVCSGIGKYKGSDCSNCEGKGVTDV